MKTQKSKKSKTVYAFLILILVTSVSHAATLINGAGATFPYPLYSKWFSEYQKKNSDVRINYLSIGSGGGIRGLLDKTVDFGASDAPMTDEQLAKAGAPIIHVPTALGAVAVTYNLPGVEKGLKLSSDVLANIFLGKITKWNDERIIKLNPKVNLPASDILVARRSDGSGTSAIFTEYLSKVSHDWKEKVGAGTSVQWPVGLGDKGNEGVAGRIKQTPGSIGYVELVFALNNNLSYAALKNKAGAFVMPDLNAITAAATSALKKMPEDFRVSITDAEGKKAYPISGFTYLLFYTTMADAEKAAKLKRFLGWALNEGQALSGPLHYAALPKDLVKKIENKLKLLK